WLLALSNGSTRARAMDSFSPRTAAETCSYISPLSSVPALVLSTRVKQSNIRLSVIAARSLRTTLRSVDRDWSLATSRPPTRAAAARAVLSGSCLSNVFEDSILLRPTMSFNTCSQSLSGFGGRSRELAQQQNAARLEAASHASEVINYLLKVLR